MPVNNAIQRGPELGSPNMGTPSRESGSCFKCGSLEHFYRECPNIMQGSGGYCCTRHCSECGICETHWIEFGMG